MTPFEGRYPQASSISHCQFEAEDPLRFFVLSNVGHYFEGAPVKVKLKKFFGWPRARTIINPEIVWHSEDRIKSVEGCMSYPERPVFNLRRWEIVKVKYWTFWGKREKKFYYYRAMVLQHEIDHFDLIDPKDIHKNKYGQKN